MTLRIISGKFKGRRLRTVKGSKTRPTADRLRESVFNILSDNVHDAIVLDLFAGTGALGIEALSRGAAFAAFVDNHPAPLSVIQQNLSELDVRNTCQIIRWNILQNLNCLKAFSNHFNLVFMDPPYEKNMIAPTLDHLHKSHSLQRDACIVIEHSLAESIPEIVSPFMIEDQRKYGKTLVSFLRFMV